MKKQKTYLLIICAIILLPLFFLCGCGAGGSSVGTSTDENAIISSGTGSAATKYLQDYSTISSIYPAQNYYGNNELQVESSSNYDSYFKFDLSSIPANSNIISATFKFRVISRENPTVYLKYCQSSWSGQSLTHNSQPLLSSTQNTLTNFPIGINSVDLTDMVKKWNNGERPNYGFVFEGYDTGDDSRSLVIENKGGSNPPYLIVVYQ